MLESLRGTVIHCSPDSVLIEWQGLGLHLRVPSGTGETLKTGAPARFFCHLLLRDDQFHLYGFVTALERDLFRTLRSVSGLGPEKALALLAAMTPQAIATAVQEATPNRFQIVRGIGARLAGRIVVELRGKLDSLAITPGGEAGNHSGDVHDVVTTLIKLGYPRSLAEEAARTALTKSAAEPSIENLVKAALHSLQNPA